MWPVENLDRDCRGVRAYFRKIESVSGRRDQGLQRFVVGFCGKVAMHVRCIPARWIRTSHE
jgi:hypothetical protein